MAAPTVTTRQTPGGIMLCNGFRAKIAFQRDPDVSFTEISVKPPSVDGGDAIETHNMHTVLYRTKCPRSLITLGDITGKVEYDPGVYSQIIELVNQNGGVTVSWADGTTMTVWAYLKMFEPDELQEGVRPEATVTIVVTNYDEDNDVEAGPVITSVTGT